MKTLDGSNRWTIRLARSLETVLFTAATCVIAAGVVMVLLRPTFVLG